MKIDPVVVKKLKLTEVAQRIISKTLDRLRATGLLMTLSSINSDPRFRRNRVRLTTGPPSERSAGRARPIPRST